MKKTLLSLSIAVTAILFSGCGGTSASDASGSTTTISGTVADGYLRGAVACLDKNLNNVCDVNEPQTVTTVGGMYTIVGVSQSDADSYPILVEVGADTIDEDDNTSVGTKYSLSAPAGDRFISPISTLVHHKMNENGINRDAARASVASSLGITNSELVYKDYIIYPDAESADVHVKAKAVAILKMGLLNSLGDGVAGEADANVLEIPNKSII